jgi:tRNA nucleotidyltransferase (CCA-adding enzyme)
MLEGQKNRIHFSKYPNPEEYLKILCESGLTRHLSTYNKILELAALIKNAGGHALLVGGCVRDFLMGRTSKDFDIEVYGLQAIQVEEIVKTLGKVKEAGKAFGILKFPLEGGLEIDVSLPRTDSKIGVGHRGFEVKSDPFMSIEDAARRRDFTINSVAADPLTGQLYDPFCGVEDIKSRILRITDKERFRDDPLRVLRALQFIGRFGLKLDEASIPVIQEMVSQLVELPKERIGEEWKKLLLKSEKPSLGLSAGMKLGVFKEIHPELYQLNSTIQEPEWHPEGDVWTHTLMVVDEAAKIVRRENLEDDEALTILLAALCHDLGKPEVTEFREGRIKSIGHEAAGEEPARRFLISLCININIIDKVARLVTNHLVTNSLYREERKENSITDGAIRRLARSLYPATIQELILMGEADHFGRGSLVIENTEQENSYKNEYRAGLWLLERARILDVESKKPTDLIRGSEWINLGFKSGINIGKMIDLSNHLRDEMNFTREMVLKAVEGVNTAESAIGKLESLLETNNFNNY